MRNPRVMRSRNFLFLSLCALITVFMPLNVAPSAQAAPRSALSPRVSQAPLKPSAPSQSATGPTTITVPASAHWVDTGYTVNTGDEISVAASGSWSPGWSFGVWGPDGATFEWPDNFLNLQDIGSCAFCAHTNTPHFASLIGYIGSAPPQPGGYTSPSVLPEAQKVFFVGRCYHAPASHAGRLYLNFNDDAYSGFIYDNFGQVTANVAIGGSAGGGCPSATRSTLVVTDSQGNPPPTTQDDNGNNIYTFDNVDSGFITVTLLDDQGNPVPQATVELFATDLYANTVDLSKLSDPLPTNTCGVGTPQPDGSAGPPVITDANGQAKWIVTNACPGELVRTAISAYDKSDNLRLQPLVTLVFKPVHPVVLVHGINDNALDWQCDPTWGGVSDGQQGYFSLLWNRLHATYSSPEIVPYVYDDDISMNSNFSNDNLCAGQAGSPNRSEDRHVNQYAITLANTIKATYNNLTENPQHHKVALIGFSLGGAIIRSLLAGCPDPSTSVEQCGGTASMVDQVFFINSAQQGSYLENYARGLDAGPYFCGHALASYCREAIQGVFQFVENNFGPDLNSTAALDAGPLSPTIRVRDRTPLPSGIQYFNFYGDMDVQLVQHLWSYKVNIGNPFSLGDSIMLPGENNPQKATAWGGARVCQGCSGTEQYESNGSSFAQWGFQTGMEWDIGALVNQLRSGKSDVPSWCAVLGDPTTTHDLCTAPMMHIRVYLDKTQNDDPSVKQDPTAPAMLLPDTSGRCPGATTITGEIVCQMEKGDGI